jgi:hypothetical protein
MLEFEIGGLVVKRQIPRYKRMRATRRSRTPSAKSTLNPVPTRSSATIPVVESQKSNRFGKKGCRALSDASPSTLASEDISKANGTRHAR